MLVLRKLLGKPFELMTNHLRHLLSWKMVFLVAITSARRVGELRALWHDLPILDIMC